VTDIVEQVLWLASGQDDPHSATIIELCVELQSLRSERDRLAAELDAIKRSTWCWLPGDDHSYDYPLEWAEYDLDAKHSPHVEQFYWAGHLPSTWAVFTWAGDDDDGEWNVVEYETEEAARTALSPADVPATTEAHDNELGGGDQP
jgi:hypothetical protein